MQPGDRYVTDEEVQRLLDYEMERWASLMKRLSTYDGPPRETGA